MIDSIEGVNSLYHDEDTHRVFINIDALLDFRLGALKLIHPDLAFLAATNVAYFTREVDQYESEVGLFNRDMYKAIQDKFKVEIVQASGYTRLIELLQEYVVAYFKKAVTGPSPNSIEFTINLEEYPFTKEQVKSLEEFFMSYMGGFNVKVFYINVAMNKLDLSELPNKHDAYFIYEHHELLNANESLFKSKRLRSTKLFAPKVFLLQPPTDELKTHLKKLRLEPFEAWRLEYLQIVNYEFIPIMFFCELSPINCQAFDRYASTVNNKVS